MSHPDTVYVIYSADVLSETSRFINDMSPEHHMPAGFRQDTPAYAERARVASLFALTEEDDQYEYGYLAGEHGRNGKRYLALADRPDPDDDPDGYDSWPGEGQHRKWVGELTWAEWLVFADAYLIDLDADGMPERYEETMGSITEHGHLDAISVDNTEGWADSHGEVIDSRMYVSFGSYRPRPYSEPGLLITNRYFGGRVFHCEREGRSLIVDTLQGTSGPVPGYRTDSYRVH